MNKLQLFSTQILNHKYYIFYLFILRVAVYLTLFYFIHEGSFSFCMNNKNTDPTSYLFGANQQNQRSIDIQQLETRCNQLENQVKNFHSLYDISQRKLLQLQEDYNLLSQKYNQLTQINQELYTENLQQKQHLLGFNNEALKDTVQTQQTEIDMLKRHCRLLERQNEELRNQIFQLQQTNTELERRLNSNFFLF